MKIQKPSIGRIVDVAIKRDGTVVHRPAIVVQYWEGGDMINAKVFLDGGNDGALVLAAEGFFCLWLTSIHHNADGVIPDGHIATWRYLPRVDDQIEVNT